MDPANALLLSRLSPNVRRSPRRIALRELSVTSPLRRSVSGNGIGISGANLPPSPMAGTSSPDERIIQLRGRRTTAVRNILTDMDEMETDDNNNHSDKLPDLPSPAAGLDDSGFDSPDGAAPLASTPAAETSRKTKTVTSLSAATRKRLQMSPTKDQNKRKRVPRKQKEVTLATSLKGLTQEQLIDIICGLVDKHMDLEQEVKELTPAPDLEPLRERLIALERNIYKSFPYSRYGSSRDAFCFRRVKTHLEQFKRECLDMSKSLLAAHNYLAAGHYIVLAWDFAQRLPDWDNFDHNKIKSQCFKQLAAQCVQIVKKSSLEKEQLRELKDCIAQLEDAGQYLAPCIAHFDKTLDKLR